MESTGSQSGKRGPFFSFMDRSVTDRYVTCILLTGKEVTKMSALRLWLRPRASSLARMIKVNGLRPEYASGRATILSSVYRDISYQGLSWSLILC